MIILMSWLDEMFEVPSRIFGRSFGLGGNWHEAAWESVIVILVAIPVLILTTSLIKHLHYLESFIRVCAWCRKINLNNNWVPLETYLGQNKEVEFTHGICDCCAQKMLSEETSARQ